MAFEYQDLGTNLDYCKKNQVAALWKQLLLNVILNRILNIFKLYKKAYINYNPIFFSFRKNHSFVKLYSFNKY